MSSIIKRRRTRRSAFTLIELLLVLVILAVLATIVVVKFDSIFGQSDETKVRGDIAGLDQAIEQYHITCHEYPQSLDNLINNPGKDGWSGPYVKKGLPLDPWKHSYQYQYPGAHNQGENGFDLWSDGNSGKKQGPWLDNWSAETGKK